MKIACFTFLISIFISFSAHAQTDSTPVDSPDTSKIIEPEISKEPVNHHVQQSGKTQVYKLNPPVDIPIVAVGTIWCSYAFTKIYNKPSPTVEQIQNLKVSNINSFDRWAVYPYSKSLDDLSYYPFYTAIPLPFVFFLTTNETRSDFFKLSFLYWETMSVTGLFGVSATYFVDRYRPYAYSDETPMEKRTGHVARNSFYAGHVEVVAASTFFISKVYSDYFPDSKAKWVFYGVASAATGWTAYMRLKGGQHFPTDILLGATTGILSGILVPQYHKNKSGKNTSLNILPFSTGSMYGLALNYQFNK